MVEASVRRSGDDVKSRLRIRGAARAVWSLRRDGDQGQLLVTAGFRHREQKHHGAKRAGEEVMFRISFCPLLSIQITVTHKII